MRKTLFLLLISLLSSTGIAIAAENTYSNDKTGIAGPDSKHVTGGSPSASSKMDPMNRARVIR